MFGGVFPLDSYVTVAAGICVIAGTIRSVRRYSPPNPLSVVLLTGGILWLSGGIRQGPTSPADALSALDLFSAPSSTRADLAMSGLFGLGVFHWLKQQHLSTWLARSTSLGTIVLVQPLYSSFSNQLVLRGFGFDASGEWLPSMETVSYSFSTGFGMASVVESAFLLWLVYFWGRMGPAGMDDTVRAVGLTGGVMANVTDQSTRLLCASGYLVMAARGIRSWPGSRTRTVPLRRRLGLIFGWPRR